LVSLNLFCYRSIHFSLIMLWLILKGNWILRIVCTQYQCLNCLFSFHVPVPWLVRSFNKEIEGQRKQGVLPSKWRARATSCHLYAIVSTIFTLLPPGSFSICSWWLSGWSAVKIEVYSTSNLLTNWALFLNPHTL